MASSLFQVVYNATKIFLKAVTKAIREEIEMSQRAAKRRYGKTENDDSFRKERRWRMSLEEAKKILNVQVLDENELENNYKHLFEANKSSSFYILSKVFRAKERIDLEMKKTREKLPEEKNN